MDRDINFAVTHLSYFFLIVARYFGVRLFECIRYRMWGCTGLDSALGSVVL